MPDFIFKIKPPAGSKFNAVNYNAKKQEKGDAKLIYFQNFGHLQDQTNISKAAFISYLERQSALNRRMKNPQFHGIISCKGKSISSEDLRTYATEIMRSLGYGQQPVLMYAHNDTEHNHLHIVTTRVDRNGKKIDHSFEQKRANGIVQALLSKNPQMEFEENKKRFLQYRFSTVAQFNLLMEQCGYKLNKENGAFHYFKYGNRQGTIQQNELQNLLSKDPDAKQLQQMKAIVYKYHKIFDTSLHHSGNGLHPSQKKEFRSDLTEKLSNLFGWKFVFFAAKDHHQPYGYAIIDHRNQAVYKGSEVMPLNQLISSDNRPTTGPDKDLSLYSTDKDTSALQHTISGNEFSKDAILNDKETAHLIDALLHPTPASKKSAPTSDMKRKRKRRFY